MTSSPGRGASASTVSADSTPWAALGPMRQFEEAFPRQGTQQVCGGLGKHIQEIRAILVLIKQLEILTPTTLVQEISALELAAQIRISMVDHVGAVRTLVRLSTYPSVDEKQLAERIWSSIKKIPLG